MKIRPNPFHSQINLMTINRKDGKPYTVRKSRDRYFFPDEWMAFYDSLDKLPDKYSKQQITFMVLLHTGARIMEVQNIKVSDIDFENKIIKLTKTKSKSIREIFVSSLLIEFLKKVISEYNLSTENYLPILDTSSGNRAMKKALIESQIPDWQMFSIHNIRITYVCWQIISGVGIYNLMLNIGSRINIKKKILEELSLYKNEIQYILGYTSSLKSYRPEFSQINNITLSLDIPKNIRLAVFMRDNYTCQICNYKNGQENSQDKILTIDHIIPISLGGTSIISNLNTLCMECNIRKNDKVNLNQLGIKYLNNTS